MDGLIEAIWSRFKRLASATNRTLSKEIPMDDATKQEVQTLVAEAVKTATEQLAETAAAATAKAVTAAVAPLVERLGKVESAAKPPATDAGDDADKPLTGKQLDERLAKRDADAAESAKKAGADKAKADAAAKYAAEKMKDLPEVYRAKLPATADAAELAAAEQEIRKGFTADMAAVGVKLPDVGTPAGAGKSAGSVEPDLSKMSPAQMIAAGLEEDAAGQAAGK